MNEAPRTNSRIETEFRSRTRASAELYARAARVIPAGLTHDSRTLLPYPIYAAKAKGPRKWDADGHEYVDYFGGHGALILGHVHPAVVEAVQRQIEIGTHWGSSHELEVRWAELISRVVPCAERVRFTASGTEATHLALRLAWAFAGKPKIVRFVGHFHGWHDQVAGGANSHFDGGTPAGILPGITGETILVSADDLEAVTEVLEWHSDIAAVMLEPSGGCVGTGAAGAGLPRGPAPVDDKARRSADLRRGGNGLPLVQGRGAGALCRHPVHLSEAHGLDEGDCVLGHLLHRIRW